MNIFRFSYIFALVTTVAIPVGITSAQAQVRAGVTAAQSGNSSASANRFDTATADATAKSARLAKSLDCKLFKLLGSCATIGLDVSPNGGRASVSIGGRTVFSKRFTKPGSAQFGPYLLDIYKVPPFEIFNFDLVSIKASGEAGAGAQFGATWGFQRMPLRADLNGAAQTWGNATGRIKAAILFGAASGEANATLNFFNTGLNADLHATPQGLQNSHASLSVILWELWLKLKAKVLGITIASKTIVHETGPSFTKVLF